MIADLATVDVCPSQKNTFRLVRRGGAENLLLKVPRGGKAFNWVGCIREKIFQVVLFEFFSI